MGLFSTLIFLELIFWFIWGNELIRELEQLLFNFGYSIKYRLDKNFVFKKDPTKFKEIISWGNYQESKRL